MAVRESHAIMIVRILAIMPTVFLSWCAYLVSRITRPVFIKNMLIRVFVRVYHVDTSVVEKELPAYRSFGRFFIRKLKPEARPVHGDKDAIVSPADGRIVQSGTIGTNTEFEVKGSLYTAADLLGDREAAERFSGGCFAVIHLRPFDYHRVHMPCSARVTGHCFFKGRLLPVNEKGLRAFRNLYMRNRRRATLFEGECGFFAMIKIGAFNVGRIPVEYKIPDSGSGLTLVRSAQEFAKGEEVARFELGSTVILFFEKDRVALDELKANREVRMGNIIGRIKDYHKP